jgi:hypothetical protein
MDNRSSSSSIEFSGKLERLLRDIKFAYYASLALGIIDIIALLFAQPNPSVSRAIIGGLLIEIVICFSLGLGISRKSHICAILMLGYYVLGKLLTLSLGYFSLFHIPLTLIFTRYFYQGVIATSTYKRLK